MRRSSLTSRSSCFTRSSSAVVSPGRRPVSRSYRRIQDRSVSGVQPIFSAIDFIAAHCEGWAEDCSLTMRTARSRTSGENRETLGMTPTSQGVESPAIPGRFTMSDRLTWLTLARLELRY